MDQPQEPAVHWLRDIMDREAACGLDTFGCRGPARMPSGASAYGLASILRRSESARASSRRLRPLAIVPPLAPPLAPLTRRPIDVQGSPNRAR